jgi:hypothetical protein
MTARIRLATSALGATLVALALLAWLGYGRPEVLLWLGSSLVLCA